MKKLLLVLLLFPLLSVAQDWHTVPVGQHNIYRVSVTGADSIWNNYVRNIYVENVMTGFSGDQFNFYRSLRRDENEILDSTKGPTWLGRFTFRENSGDEIFLNKYLDSITIKTLGQVNDTWTLGFDTTGSIRFEATIISHDTMTIDGVVDSIKRIEIQAFSGTTPSMSIYNNYQIVLSKAHGFYEVFDFYGFPNYDIANLASNPVVNPLFDSMAEIYPILPYLHTRVDSSIANLDYTATDISFQYQPGNEWIIEYYITYLPSHIYDSIQSVNIISPDTFVVTYRRDETIWTAPNGPNPAFQTFNTGTYTDTVYNTSQNRSLVKDTIENRIMYPSINGIRFRWSYLDKYCQNKVLVRDTSSWRSILSGNGQRSHRYHKDLNLDIDYFSNFQSSTSLGYREFAYYNFNGCTYGTYFPLRPNATSNYNQSDLFKIYPNPTSSSFNIESDLDWKKVEIISLQGKVVKSFTYEQQYAMDMNSLPVGLHILKVSTETGNYIYKILKE